MFEFYNVQCSSHCYLTTKCLNLFKFEIKIRFTLRPITANNVLFLFKLSKCIWNFTLKWPNLNLSWKPNLNLSSNMADPIPLLATNKNETALLVTCKNSLEKIFREGRRRSGTIAVSRSHFPANFSYHRNQVA